MKQKRQKRELRREKPKKSSEQLNYERRKKNMLNKHIWGAM